MSNFTCPWCKRKKEKLLSTSSHDWICYDCAADLEDKGEPVKFDEPAAPAILHDYWPNGLHKRR